MLPLNINWRIVAVCGGLAYLLYTNYLLHHYEIKSQEQAQTIEAIQKENNQLTNQLTIERKAVINQISQEQQAREQAENDVKIIYKTLSSDSCASARLPDDIINRLRAKDKD
ncbi:DUF2570 domain-containing protein [Gallibacterium salpingitidis]|uniref:DUF2570 family protein n=1 Tax=Gallibacterium salpingitidis TaxID=505341 RepID=UPI00266F1538|nr:DUF2570 family protein [Gallibacterium salpingitidis]WKT00517.1 DUF2570 domain-containing protein [Gallibacterium salpingitidis]